MRSKNVEAMKAAEREYLARAHPTKRHSPATKALLQLWSKKSRAERKDYWVELDSIDPNVYGKEITATKIKAAFRSYMDGPQSGRCCYCRIWLVNIAHARPIDHILPRDTYPQHSLHFWNLAVACTDCNGLKTNRVWGVFSKSRRNYPRQEEFADMFHARFHKYDEHVRYVIIETNNSFISLYRGLTKQGRHLCSELLDTIAARRMVFSTNPLLRESKATIEQFKNKTSALSLPAVQEFETSLNATVQKFIS
jgi:uncharacterized protein (TIGR02646 family)